MDKKSVESQEPIARSPEVNSSDDNTAEVISNMALAHELVMNESFKLEELPGNS